MSVFSKAVLAGLQSAKVADRDTREIIDAIAELAVAVEEVSDGVVTVVRERSPEGKANIFNAVNHALTGFNDIKWVTTINLKRKVPPLRTAEIARIDIPSSGYPCEVSYGIKNLTCYDRPSLVGVLEGVLSSPEAGRSLLKLMSMKEETQPEEPQSD